LLKKAMAIIIMGVGSGEKTDISPPIEIVPKHEKISRKPECGRFIPTG